MELATGRRNGAGFSVDRSLRHQGNRTGIDRARAGHEQPAQRPALHAGIRRYLPTSAATGVLGAQAFGSITRVAWPLFELHEEGYRHSLVVAVMFVSGAPIAWRNMVAGTELVPFVGPGFGIGTL